MSLDTRRLAQHPLRSEVYGQVKDFGEITEDARQLRSGPSKRGWDRGKQNYIKTLVSDHSRAEAHTDPDGTH